MQKVQELLEKKTVGNYKKAARIIARERSDIYAPELFNFLQEVITNPKRWEISCELIKTLGLVNYQPLLEVLTPILHQKKEYDMVSMVASTAYVRLKRNDLHDGVPVLSLIKEDCYSITEGALEALGYDKMIPDEQTQDEIISKCWDFGKDRNKNAYTDPRYGLAAACAGWSSSQVDPFLEHCLQSGDVPLEYVAQNSLKRKYVKLR